MSLLPILLYLAVGCSEWYLALRRTLACARGEKTLLVAIVFVENMLGLWVLSDFARSSNWWVALAYSVGGAGGALMVNLRESRTRKARRLAGRRVRAKPSVTSPSPAAGVPSAA